MNSGTERLKQLADLLVQEGKRLAELVEHIDDDQWYMPPKSSMPVDDVRVAKGGRVPDPTGETVVNPARLAVRHQFQRSERLVTDAVVKARGVRRGFERSYAGWMSDHAALTKSDGIDV